MPHPKFPKGKESDKFFIEAKILLETALVCCPEKNKLFTFECPLCGFDEAIGAVHEIGMMTAECPNCRKSITLKGLK